MDTGDYIFWLGYPLGWLFTSWRVAGQIAWNEAKRYNQKVPDGGDIMWAIFLASIAALVWPLSLPAAVMIGSVKNGGRNFLYTPKHIKLELAERRIRELEREVGIR